MFQMRRDAIEAVCPERAVLAAFVPVRPVHEVIDQQLAAALEQLRKGLAAVRPIEDVLFLHLHPRQCAALLAQSVALPGKLLLFGQKPRATPTATGTARVTCSIRSSCRRCCCISASTARRQLRRSQGSSRQATSRFSAC